MLYSEMEPLLPKFPRPLVAGIVSAIIMCGFLSIKSCVRGNQSSAAMQQADQHHAAAITHAAQGAAHDQQATINQPTINQNDTEVARLRKEVVRLRQAALAPVSQVAPAAISIPQPNQPSMDMGNLLDAQELLIQGLETQSSGLKEQLQTITMARDSWKAAYTESSAENVQLRIANAAQQGLISGATWTGRIQGLAVGLSVGYISGRLQ